MIKHQICNRKTRQLKTSRHKRCLCVTNVVSALVWQTALWSAELEEKSLHLFV